MKYLELFEDYINKDFGIFNNSKYIDNMIILNIDECVEYILKNCKEFIDKPVFIKRYISVKMNNSFKATPIERISRDNANYYTILIDNSENWKNYPKRSKSFICSMMYEKYNVNDLKISNDNSGSRTELLVIPNDNSIFGICPADDIYYSFERFKIYRYSLAEFFDDMNKLSIFFNLGGISDDNIDDMKKDIRKLQDQLYNKANEKYIPYFNLNSFYKFISDYPGEDIFELLEKLMSPDINHFKLQKYTEMKINSEQVEVWTDSPCIFINGEHIEEVLKKLREITHKEINL